MSSIGAVDFTAGPAGGNVTTANTPGINGTQSGTLPVFAASIPTNGTGFSAQTDQVGGTSFNNVTWAQQTTTWIGFYFRLTATASAHSYWLGWYNATPTRIGDLYWVAGLAQLGMRDNFGSIATSPTLTLNTWHRAAVKCIPGSATGHRLKLYLGTNLHGATADYDSGDLAATSAALTNIGSMRFGYLSGTEAHYQIARIRADNAVEPAALASVITSDAYYADAGSWKSLTVKVAKAGAWA